MSIHSSGKQLISVLAFVVLTFIFALIVGTEIIGESREANISDPGVNSVTGVIPYESEGEPGLWPGYEAEKVPPIPGPVEDADSIGTKAPKVELTPERMIKKPTVLTGVQPGPPAPTVTQRTGALTGKIIFVNPGHGWYYSSGWKTQRPDYNDVVEDHHNADQVCYYMLQYLRNAGATVVPLRDVGPQTPEVHIIDNDDSGFTLSGTWYQSTGTPFWGDDSDAVRYVYAATSLQETAVARWTPNFSQAGYYPVFVWYLDSSNRSRDARYRIVHKGGISYVTLNQTRVGKGWIWLGTYYFEAGSNGYLELTNQSSETGRYVIADAARFGSGVHSSGYPWYEMQALEYMSYNKAPSSVTGVSDVWCRPRMAAYMNNAPIQDVCYISFHSNGGGGRGAMVLKNDPSWEGGAAPYADQFNSAIIRQVEDDLYTFWGLPRRGYQVYTSQYGELTYNNLNGEMAGTIVEVAFHDNADDANLLKTAGFRQDAARAVLQGIIDYFVNTHSHPNGTYLPDAPGNVSAEIVGAGQVRLRWSAPPYGGYGAHQASGYVVYRSTDGLAWDTGIDVGNVLSYTYSGLSANQVYYFRVSAYNAGGESFPSETVGVRMTSDGSRAPVLIVNGYRRYDRMIAADYYDAYNGWSKRVWPWLINSFNYVVAHGNALRDAGYYFESTSNERIIDGSILLNNYGAVDWILGRESVADETFNSTEQTKVANYLNNYGRLFVSGEELGWDLELQSGATQADKDFLNNVLQVRCTSDDGSSSNQASPVSGSIFAGLSQISFAKDYANGHYDTVYPDVFAGLGEGASNALTYSDTGQVGCVQFQNAVKRLVVMGFPFEMIQGATARANVMGRIMNFLLGGGTPTPTPTPTLTNRPTNTPTPTPTATPTVTSATPTPSPSGIGQLDLVVT
ncbi:MAG: fibronectin type III domain-containing protein, partial [Candidatus Sumerlaeia bacterium]|nr:fibronectin type III domain-containing protein [Candidatus Sumerlaeia bacterium]